MTDRASHPPRPSSTGADPTYPPVAALDVTGKRVRRFLGGAYASGVPSVPEGATPVGVGAEGRLWTVPGDESALFVESAGMISDGSSSPVVARSPRCQLSR